MEQRITSEITRIIAMSVLMLAVPSPARAQFSPGPLSSAHAALEGSTNCTQCHDVGKEIAGSKCLVCHAEIGAAGRPDGGFHATVSARQVCVDCHKEHLGRDAKTFAFEPSKFDHDLTGFLLSGKHGTLRCEQCHSPQLIRKPAVKKMLAGYPHTTYLGLEAKCSGCHADAHRGKFGADCASCHRPSAWKDVASFDHSVTKFPLSGKHANVSCAKCHTPGEGGGKARFAAIPETGYSDCTPCHTSEHRAAVVKNACRNCHETGGWELAMNKSFDHGLTRYGLEGGHARAGCLACHAPGGGKTFLQVFRRPFGRCTDCHSDRHNGAFKKTYGNDCALCHTVSGYSPSTFTFASHQKTSWPLSGAHMAVLCVDCHRNNTANASWKFAFGAEGCLSCHTDVHGGQFTAQMASTGCATCHETSAWKPALFRHLALTGFPLEGKHAAATCGSCHREIAGASTPGGKTARVKFTKLSADCEGCHADRHRAQFSSDGTTKCETCHGPSGWTSLTFNHETGSRFSLKGGHANVPCADCHRPEREGSATFIRYKPLSVECESCHQTKVN